MRTVLVVSLLVACSGSSKSTSSTTTPAGGDTAGGDTAGGNTGGSAAGGAMTAAEVAGYYDGDWGQMVIREKDGKLLASYSHDEGTIVGTLQGDTLVGWWCEVPSRKPNNDAGDVQLKFVTRDGKKAIDGRWRYGNEDEFREDWDIERSDGAPDPTLLKRFDDPSAFCAKP